MYAVGLDGLVNQFNSILNYTFPTTPGDNFCDLLALSGLPISFIVKKGYSLAEIRQIIFGSLLGNVQLEFLVINARFGFEQSIGHELYFLFLYSILQIFCELSYRASIDFDFRT